MLQGKTKIKYKITPVVCCDFGMSLIFNYMFDDYKLSPITADVFSRFEIKHFTRPTEYFFELHACNGFTDAVFSDSENINPEWENGWFLDQALMLDLDIINASIRLLSNQSAMVRAVGYFYVHNNTKSFIPSWHLINNEIIPLSGLPINKGFIRMMQIVVPYHPEIRNILRQWSMNGLSWGSLYSIMETARTKKSKEWLERVVGKHELNDFFQTANQMRGEDGFPSRHGIGKIPPKSGKIDIHTACQYARKATMELICELYYKQNIIHLIKTRT